MSRVRKKTKRELLQELRRKGKLTKTSLFNIYSLESKSAGHLFIIVSTKVLKGAVERNKLRRQLRELFKNTQAESENKNILIVAKKEAAGRSFKDLQRAANN